MKAETLDEKVSSALDAASLIQEDIVGRFPIWLEHARANSGKVSSPFMFVSSVLLSQAVACMLHAQVPGHAVEKMAGDLFDMYTDPELAAQLCELREDKAEIMKFVSKMIMDNESLRAKNRAAN